MKVSRALLSVSDKTGLEALARALADRGTTIISTGGTADALRSWGIEVVSVDSTPTFTGDPRRFRLGVEALRIENAFRHDMAALAVRLGPRFTATSGTGSSRTSRPRVSYGGRLSS